MRLATILTADGPRVVVARRRADGGGEYEYVDLAPEWPGFPTSIRELLSMPIGLDAVRDAAESAIEVLPDEAVRLLPPIPDPEKVICIGLNYADHAAETGAKVGQEPVVFCKFPTVIRGPGQPIELPSASSEVDYEAELVVVIGREAKNVPRERALDYVAGYTCGNDVSARDWQKHKPGGQWLLGKSFDSFGPTGPHLVTADEVADPHKLPIRLQLNGNVMQDSTTAQLIFRIDFLVAYLSRVCTLRAGDLIFTGTPPGVGMARKPPVFLQAGDAVEVSIEGVGVLENPVVAAGGE